MARPDKYDRTKKLIAYETSFVPLEVFEKRETVMVIVFDRKEVTHEDIAVINNKIKKAIPRKLEYILGEYAHA